MDKFFCERCTVSLPAPLKGRRVGRCVDTVESKDTLEERFTCNGVLKVLRISLVTSMAYSIAATGAWEYGVFRKSNSTCGGFNANQKRGDVCKVEFEVNVPSIQSGIFVSLRNRPFDQKFRLEVAIEIVSSGLLPEFPLKKISQGIPKLSNISNLATPPRGTFAKYFCSM